jgi:hypothetical protein
MSDKTPFASDAVTSASSTVRRDRRTLPTPDRASGDAVDAVVDAVVDAALPGFGGGAIVDRPDAAASHAV